MTLYRIDRLVHDCDYCLATGMIPVHIILNTTNRGITTICTSCYDIATISPMTFEFMWHTVDISMYSALKAIFQKDPTFEEVEWPTP